MSKGGHRREVRQTHRNRESTQVDTHKCVATYSSDRLWEHWHQVLLGLCPRFCRFRNLHRTSSTANFGKVGFLGCAEFDIQFPSRRVKAPLCKGSCQRSCLREKTQKNKPQGLFFLQRRGKLLTHSCFTVSF